MGQKTKNFFGKLFSKSGIGLKGCGVATYQKLKHPSTHSTIKLYEWSGAIFVSKPLAIDEFDPIVSPSLPISSYVSVDTLKHLFERGFKHQDQGDFQERLEPFGLTFMTWQTVHDQDLGS